MARSADTSVVRMVTPARLYDTMERAAPSPSRSTSADCSSFLPLRRVHTRWSVCACPCYLLPFFVISFEL